MIKPHTIKQCYLICNLNKLLSNRLLRYNVPPAVLLAAVSPYYISTLKNAAWLFVFGCWIPQLADGIDNRIFFTGVSLEMSRSHSGLQLCLEYCLYERAIWESSPYSLLVTIATDTKVKSKKKTSLKLKVLSLSDTTRIQSSPEFFINSSLTDGSF